MNIWEKIKKFFGGSTILQQFKEIIEEEKIILKKLETDFETSIDKVEETIKTEVKAVNDQITDAVTQTKKVVKKPRKKKS